MTFLFYFVVMNISMTHLRLQLILIFWRRTGFDGDFCAKFFEKFFFKKLKILWKLAEFFVKIDDFFAFFQKFQGFKRNLKIESSMECTIWVISKPKTAISTKNPILLLLDYSPKKIQNFSQKIFFSFGFNSINSIKSE